MACDVPVGTIALGRTVAAFTLNQCRSRQA